MLARCQHIFAFSRINWYTLAIGILKDHKRNYSYGHVSTSSPLIKTTSVEINPVSHILKPKKKMIRCSGFKKYDGQRCKRKVKTTLDTVYCFDHHPIQPTKKKKKGQFSADIIELPMYTKKSVDEGNKLYDCWDLWIKPYIKKESRQLIRREMKRPLTKTDKPGYIYAYSFENGPLASTDAFAYFKIGRTADPHRRMYQVAHLCNHMPKIIELFPSFPLVTDRPYMSTNLETLDRKIQQLPKCPATHRVERLILLELSSLYEKADVKCSACGQLHREWIRVERTRYADGTLMTDQELWTSNIKPVVLRWIQYGVLASAINKENFIYK